MKYDDKVDLYSDEGKVLAEDIPIEALNPLKNPYMGEVYVTLKKTVLVDLKKMQDMLRNGEAGWATLVGQDEVKMPWYGFEVDLVENANEIADEVRKLIQINKDDDTKIMVLEDGNTLVILAPEERLRRSTGYISPYLTVAGALGQIIAKMANLSPVENVHRLGLLKNCLFGRYPATIAPQPGNPVAPLLKFPMSLEGMGTAFKSMMINHIVALANNRTLHGAALATILEQGGEYECGDCVGWYERSQLLASAYQGFNANNLVLDLIKENRDGTAYDVLISMMTRAYEDGVIKKPDVEAYPYVQPSGYVLWNTSDYPIWNAYTNAAMLAGVCVNTGASRSVQTASAVLGYLPDMLGFEAGGLPDPDSGRLMGTGLGFQFYTHGIYGGAGPGAFTMDHAIARSTSGYLTPCIVAGMCLDAGTQIFKPTTTSGLYYVLADNLPVFKDPMRQVAEAAENIKKDL
ncbi:MAG: methyl-coenzyme M reductase subunit beta [Thermodesulfobacteriota bacterium]|nr:methyl-coenzyme M reductase subunit beta [Thermodesulfobacteriota bacterium]